MMIIVTLNLLWMMIVMNNIVFYELVVNDLYQAFGSGLILGFSLVMICLLISALIHLLKGLFKESIK